MTDFSRCPFALGQWPQGAIAPPAPLSENIANTDTPGYRRKTVPFKAVFDISGQPGRVETGASRSTGRNRR